MTTENKHKPAKIPTSKKARAMYYPRVLTPKDIVYWLRVWQPLAREIRSEGKCPNCKRHAQVSYILTEFMSPRNDGTENCGYYCGWCGWGIAGSRDVIDPLWQSRETVKL